MNPTIPFVIDHLDPLGQGVSKRISSSKQSTITFIPKTLPGEQGTAKVIKSSKGVEFAELDTITQSSPQRIEPECMHYAQCSGCDYLHASYADELVYKKAALLFLLRSFNLDDSHIDLMPAPQRFNYRNRVQLHYRHKYLGLINANTDQVLEVPQCRLPSSSLKMAIDLLYTDKNWTQDHQGRGHVELYEREDHSTVVEWNQPYAHGGFSQVNPQMNTVLRQWLENYFKNIHFETLLDLFSGNGNLSNDLVKDRKIQLQMVDMSSWNGMPADENYLQLDLFSEGALESFQRRAKWKKTDVLLLDPPRKGFPVLAEWVHRLTPQHIAYVSCNPVTLSRDLKALMTGQKKIKYAIEKVVLLDMFPGTHHFETIIILKKK